MLKIIKELVDLFKVDQKFDVLLIIVWVTINLLVGINNYLHTPVVGYDSIDHLAYVRFLTDHLPTPKDSFEFFSPPLPYFIPSLAYRVCVHIDPTGDCQFFSGRVAQLTNFFLSLGITLFFIKISNLLRPGNRYFKISALTMLGLLTVYYKTFSQVRGEPYVAFFVVLVMYVVLKMLKSEAAYWLKDGTLLGILLGLLILSRQWGFFLFPSIAGLIALAWIRKEKYAKSLTLTFLTSVFVAFFVGGWFYIHLFKEYGSFTAFNNDRQAKSFSFSNQPLSFYTSTGLSNLLLFKSPTRPTFDNQLVSIFYSDTWGDYWGYFVFIREKSYWAKIGYANQDEITPYLGRVNLVSLFPTAILLAGLLLGFIYLIRAFDRQAGSIVFMSSFLFLIVVLSLTGYLGFLITYPIPKGLHIKPTYMIQIFMALPFLSAEVLEKIRSMNVKSYWSFLIILLLVFLHNLPAMISRYTIYLVAKGG